MLRNIIKIVIRNLKRNFAYSFINIFGLGIGIAASFVILMYVQQELSYEKHFSENEQIYRVGTKFMSMGRFANGPEILPNTLNEELPYITSSTSLNSTGDISLSIPGFEVTKSGLYVDSAFFKIFDYKFSHGNKDLALKSQNSIVITEKLAISLFGKSDAVGKIIELTGKNNNKAPVSFNVSGVVDIRDINSHLNADFWAYHSVKKNLTSGGLNDGWLSISMYNYVKLDRNVDQLRFQTDLDSLISRHVFPSMESGLSFKDWSIRDDSFLFIAQPINDIYLKSTLSFDLMAGGDETTVYALLAIALLVLVIASVNFINLTTAKSINRAKEVGVKKSLGSSRSALIAQFLIESITLSLIAMVFAMGFSELFLITFKYATDQSLVLELFTNYQHVLWLISLSLSIGLIAGIYPAFYLSGFKTSQILKGSLGTTPKSSFRNVLVVFQFFLSISLICLAWIVHTQLDYLKNKDLGFDQEQVMIINNAEKLGNDVKVFKEQLSQRAEVSSSAFVRRMPGSTSSYSISKLKLGGDHEPLKVNSFKGDEDFIKTLGFQLISGNGFEKYNKPDDRKIILNEAAVKALMLDNPIGTKFENGKEVIGVVRDFNFENLRTKVAPAIIEIAIDGNIAFKLKRVNASTFIKYAESKWLSMSPDEPLSYHFLDQNFGEMIVKERVLSKAIGIFTILSILISCLGLYGLSSYMALQRKKEIGIRKVLGASVFNMWIMLSKQFTKLIVIATVMAIPITIWIANIWLNGFVYKITISSNIFFISGFGVMLLALLTVGYESIKAALSNPAKSLKEE
jgi:putative ABC transport system permease protein